MIERERRIAESPERKKAIETVLMNPVRRKLFEYVCRHPGVPLVRCAEKVGLSLNNAKWHLIKLAKANYIAMERAGRVNIIYPREILDDELIKILARVARMNADDVLNCIMENGGISRHEIERWLKMAPGRLGKITCSLEQLGVINAIRDGRYVRYYPTGLLPGLKKSSRKRMRGFRSHIMKRFVSEGLQPAVIRADSTALIVQIRSGREKRTINLQLGI